MRKLRDLDKKFVVSVKNFNKLPRYAIFRKKALNGIPLIPSPILHLLCHFVPFAIAIPNCSWFCVKDIPKHQFKASEVSVMMTISQVGPTFTQFPTLILILNPNQRNLLFARTYPSTNQEWEVESYRGGQAWKGPSERVDWHLWLCQKGEKGY